MLIREEIEERERCFLSPLAAFSARTRGRARPEKECDFRSAFQRDRDKIIHSRAFRRLKHKTQVFISPVEDHYRTRLTHTLEVAQIARTIACALQLNESLTEAIALAHDLGHTPFGHAGEFVLDDILKTSYGRRFFHNQQSVRVVEALEKNGLGLNLCFEVIDGIRNHTPSDPPPATLEGQVARLADRFAYLRHDIEDAIQAGVLREDQLPRKAMQVLGKKILDCLVSSVIANSRGKPMIKLDKGVQTAVEDLYAFMYKNVYTNPLAKREEKKVPQLLRQLFAYYHSDPKFIKGLKKGERLQQVIDVIAGMTDRYAISKFKELFVPNEWRAGNK
jgi:dGTPase